jgi:hypothetical protein
MLKLGEVKLPGDELQGIDGKRPWVKLQSEISRVTKWDLSLCNYRRPLKSGKRSQQQTTAKVSRKPKLPKR